MKVNKIDTTICSEYNKVRCEYKTNLAKLYISDDSNSSFMERENLRRLIKELSNRMIELWNEIVNKGLQNHIDIQG